MNVLITAKLKLHTDAAQFQALRQTSLAYRAALNHVSQYSFAHGKMSNQIRLRDATYYELRARYGLPAQMATNVPRKARSDLQSAVDQGEAERCTTESRRDQEALQGPG